MTLPSIGSRAFGFARSIVVLGAAVVGVPLVLTWVAEQRFGGASPLAGVPSPAEWERARIWAALTDRLNEDTIADVVIRAALVVAWVALVVFVVTVFAEVVHMMRHAGLHLPDVRGLGVTQHAARIVAAGLLVVVPMLSSPGRAIARGDTSLTPIPKPTTATVGATRSEPALPASVAPTVVVTPVGGAMAAPDVHVAAATDARAAKSAIVPGGEYVVRTGDSIYGIAQQAVGPDATAVADYAEQLVELNLGRDMGGGYRFTNAAFIDVGWVLHLPGGAPTTMAGPSAASHVIERGETLWSIADDELGDPLRWPEVFDANAGRAFGDGRVLDDPSLIQPGWALQLPGAVAPVGQQSLPPPVVAPVDVPTEARATPAEPSESSGDLGVGHDAHHTGAITASAPVAPVAPTLEQPARPDNAWVDASDAVDGGGTAAGEQGDDIAGLMSMRGAAMLSAGVLTLLAARRRQQLRQAPPRARLPLPTPNESSTERLLRANDAAERLARVDIAVRSAAMPLIHRGRRVLAVLCAPDGELELIADGPVALAAPWVGAGDRWILPATTPIELLGPAARQVGAPCPALVQLGSDESGHEVFVDLEALEALEVGGSSADADAIVAAIAVTLAGSALAEVTPLVAAGVPTEAFLGHRLHHDAADPRTAFEIAVKAIGATGAMTASTFELRARVTSGETWEPAVVLLGSAAAVAVRPPRNRTGLAVVSAAPIEGPSSRLAPDDDGWVLRPLGLRFRPIGLRPAQVDEIADLVDGAAAIPTIPAFDDPTPDDAFVVGPPQFAPAPGHHAVAAHEFVADDDTIHTVDDHDPDDATGGGPAVIGARPRPAIRRADERAEPPPWQLLVRLLGPVGVVDAARNPVEFERSKTRELVAWLATHRERSTRANARTALWEQDVRDATFANVVSEARRSLARLVAPPEGDEWVGRTMTDALPLHSGVRSDADLVEHALAAARVQPPDQAIVTLTPAVDWIAGVPFEGTAYLWPDAEGITSSLILLAISAAAELAAHCLSVGDVEGVFRATGRGLRVLPGHEELIGLRMRAHARVGDLAGVRSEWESYERMINADQWSDGEPSPKLVDLRTLLLNPSR